MAVTHAEGHALERIRASYSHDSRVLFLPQRDVSMFLSELEDERPLSDLVLPANCGQVLMTVSLSTDGPSLSANPQTNLSSKQLMSGVRVLDVRLSVVDGVLMAYHGSTRSIFLSLPFFTPCTTFCKSVQGMPGVREEIERAEGGIGMWWLENREWEHGLEGMGIHPTKWPDSAQEGFEWDLKGTTGTKPASLARESIPVHAQYGATRLRPSSSGDNISFSRWRAIFSPFVLRVGVGWPSWGMGIRDSDSNSEKERWSISNESAELLENKESQLGAFDDDSEPGSQFALGIYGLFFGAGWGPCPLLVENNFIRRYD
ncbi:phospholipase C [Rhizoctonia solani]|uniref:Phospholipase C n=1 Tax=Rhizoctonia solani TaxID=456999 RepID=A0A8H7M7V4_9AGAM|nr:phospholipase C [Rhizoctonia solani]